MTPRWIVTAGVVTMSSALLSMKNGGAGFPSELMVLAKVATGRSMVAQTSAFRLHF